MGLRQSAGCFSTGIRLAGAALGALLVVGAVVAGLMVYQYNHFVETPVLSQDETQRLVIPQGTHWPGVVDRVEGAGLVDSGLYFDLWGRSTGLAEEVRAGTFQLDGPMALDDLAELLRRGGRADEVVVTLREGLTKFDYADHLQEAGLVDRQEFLDIVDNPERYEWSDAQKESLEGYLYPDTYRFEQGASEEAIVDRLVERWKEMMAPVFQAHSDQLSILYDDYGFDRHDVVTMASLIERETAVDAERDVISRVFYNRLDREMLLQTDPTCVYGETTYDQRPTPELCNDPYNRYSTYVVDGLPPGPIANPGDTSIEAALVPSEAPDVQDYLYFVSRRDGTGRHAFTTNYADHRQAIERHLIDR